MPHAKIIYKRSVSNPIEIPPPRTPTRSRTRESPKYNRSDTCMLCHEYFDKNELITTKKCGHNFHKHCLEAIMHSRCPECGSFFGKSRSKSRSKSRTRTR